ncbi:MAG: ABC-F type ribosomal protection protein [Clostridia bacterium]|nr:ABC-F type ribosomal protection protein [Clostridia bacterium]
MSIIQIENLTFAYPGSYDNVFENVSLTLDSDWRLGFIGRNGRGKTTLLRLLTGAYEYSGDIRSSVQFDYFPYPAADSSLPTEQVLRGVCPAAADWELQRELSLLAVEDEVLERPFATLSEGERTKCMLAALFLNEGHFLLIDEPTNHLDAEARDTLAAYLRRKSGFILVSHDRAFLDGCVDHILSINRRSIEVQSGNFSSWQREFERRQTLETAQNERLKKDISRLREAARRTADWSDKVEATKIGNGPCDRGNIGHKAAKMMKRSKAIETRRERAAAEKSKLLHDVELSGELKLSPLAYHADVLAAFSGVSVSYGGRTVCEDISFEVRRGERIALSGRNGNGKSSLLRLLLGEDIPHGGKVSVGSGLVISYVPQSFSDLRGGLADFAAGSGIDESLFKAILRKMGFERVQFEKDIAELSLGQRKKVLLARSLCERAHLYIWDEPLNYIDVFSRMQIERLIAEYAPTMVFVEHDRAFCENTATRTVSL